jgi:hypothetical protein
LCSGMITCRVHSDGNLPRDLQTPLNAASHARTIHVS